TAGYLVPFVERRRPTLTQTFARLLSLFPTQRPPPPTLFPYTTLFRSLPHDLRDAEDRDRDEPEEGHGTEHRPHSPGAATFLWFEIGRATRLNSSHVKISYAVFCLKKKRARQQGRRPILARARAQQRRP